MATIRKRKPSAWILERGATECISLTIQWKILDYGK